MNIDWGLIGTWAIAAVAFLAVILGAQYFRAKQADAHAQLTVWIGEKQADAIEAEAIKAVQAAEQWLSSSDGQAKKAWALKVLQAALTLRGVPINLTVIDAAIEAAVKLEFNQGRTPTKTLVVDGTAAQAAKEATDAVATAMAHSVTIQTA